MAWTLADSYGDTLSGATSNSAADMANRFHLDFHSTDSTSEGESTLEGSISIEMPTVSPTIPRLFRHPPPILVPAS